MSETAHNSMTYRPEIDGLRAIAVVAVILFHSGLTTVSGGFVGVDVFFVISGYLISSIIIKDLAQGRFSFSKFYERRARRILPALFLVCFSTIPFAWAWLLPEQFHQYAGSLVSTNLYYANIFFWRLSGYFDTSSELQPLLHMWSLSVEEQYYLLYPLFLLLLWRRYRGLAIALLIVAVGASFALADVGAQDGSIGAYYLLPTRAWELGVGSLLAAFPDFRQRVPSAARTALGVLGLALIFGSALFFEKTTPFPGKYALAPTLGAALVLAMVRSEDLLGRILGSKPLVAIGLASYSLYLWHQPVLAFARQRLFTNPEGLVLVLLLALIAALSYLSWRFVEKPFRDRNFFSTRVVVLTFAVSTVAVVTAGAIGSSGEGYPQRFSFIANSGEQLQLANRGNGWCFYSVDTDDRLQVGADGLHCVIGDKNSTRTALLFGDSFAGQYEPMWDSIGKSHGFSITSVTTNWCAPALTDAYLGPKSSRAFEQCKINRRFLLDHAKEFDAVILGGTWERMQNTQRLPEIADLAKWLTSMGKRVVIMPSAPAYDTNINYSFLLARENGITLQWSEMRSVKEETSREAESALRASLGEARGVYFVDKDSLFDPRFGSGHLTAEGIPYSLDGRHISAYGSRSLGRQVAVSGVGDQLTAALFGVSPD